MEPLIWIGLVLAGLAVAAFTGRRAGRSLARLAARLMAAEFSSKLDSAPGGVARFVTHLKSCLEQSTPEEVADWIRWRFQPGPGGDLRIQTWP